MGWFATRRYIAHDQWKRKRYRPTFYFKHNIHCHVTAAIKTCPSFELKLSDRKRSGWRDVRISWYVRISHSTYQFFDSVHSDESVEVSRDAAYQCSQARTVEMNNILSVRLWPLIEDGDNVIHHSVLFGCCYLCVLQSRPRSSVLWVWYNAYFNYCGSVCFCF